MPSKESSSEIIADQIRAYINSNYKDKGLLENLRVGIASAGEKEITSLFRVIDNMFGIDKNQVIIDIYNTHFNGEVIILALKESFKRFADKKIKIAYVKLIEKYIEESFAVEPLAEFLASDIRLLDCTKQVFHNKEIQQNLALFSALIKSAIENNNANLIHFISQKTGFAQFKDELDLDPKQRDRLAEILTLPKEMIELYSKHMVHFSKEFGRIDHEDGLLYVSEVHQRKGNAFAAEAYEFNPTVLRPEEFSEYINILKNVPPPVRERFVITGKHWICGEFFTDEQGKTNVLFIDGLGSISEKKKEMMDNTLAADFKQTFPDGKIYIDFLTRQRVSSCCAIFSLDDVRHLYTIERYLPKPFNERGLFAYLEHNQKQSEFLEVDIFFEYEDPTKVEVFPTDLPLPFLRTTQSTELIGEKTNKLSIIETRTQNEKEIPLGRHKSSANEFVRRKEGFHVGKSNRLVNTRLDNKFKKMSDCLHTYLMQNTDPKKIQDDMNQFLLSAFRQRISEKVDKADPSVKKSIE